MAGSLSLILKSVLADKPNLVALDYQGQVLTYTQLYQLALGISKKHEFDSKSYIVLNGDRSIEEYATIYACWLFSKPYIPLNPKFSDIRKAEILSQVFDLEPKVFDDLAYIIFTSGTTGKPKGVPIHQSQIAQYALAMQKNIAPNSSDSLLQIHDFSFDYSVMELVVAWTNGAKLIHVPTDKAVMTSRYVQDHEITLWMSVPSLASMGHKLGLLSENSLPSLRVAIFSGEALNYETIRNFSKAAPNAKLLNFHGITEATVTDTYFEIERNLLVNEAPPHPAYQVIPMGWPHYGVEIDLFDPELPKIADGVGELCISGKQVTDGYLNNPELNVQRFFEFEGKRWLRTGDLATFTQQYGYCYRGRADRQIKLKGYRIELQDVESALRNAAKTDLVCVVPYPVLNDGSIEGLVGVVSISASFEFDFDLIKKTLLEILPSYMVPSHILSIDEMPLSVNGKVDFKVVQEWVKSHISSP
jgi:acyl-CoA synthetase (AMP-forming)/AMP-acid ligase II